MTPKNIVKTTTKDSGLVKYYIYFIKIEMNRLRLMRMICEYNPNTTINYTIKEMIFDVYTDIHHQIIHCI